MAKTATITLGGTDYVIHPFNLDELEEVGDLLGNAKVITGGTMIKVLKLALRRAEPKLADPGALEALMREVTPATAVVLELSGLDAKQPDNPQAVAPAAS